MQRPPDHEADLYELDLRRKDARSTLLRGVVLLILGVAVLVGWLFVIGQLTELAPETRIRTGLLYAGLFFVVLGGASLLQGIRKHRAWKERRTALGQA